MDNNEAPCESYSHRLLAELLLWPRIEEKAFEHMFVTGCCEEDEKGGKVNAGRKQAFRSARRFLERTVPAVKVLNGFVYLDRDEFYATLKRGRA